MWILLSVFARRGRRRGAGDDPTRPARHRGAGARPDASRPPSRRASAQPTGPGAPLVRRRRADRVQLAAAAQVENVSVSRPRRRRPRSCDEAHLGIAAGLQAPHDAAVGCDPDGAQLGDADVQAVVPRGRPDAELSTLSFGRRWTGPPPRTAKRGGTCPSACGRRSSRRQRGRRPAPAAPDVHRRVEAASRRPSARLAQHPGRPAARRAARCRPGAPGLLGQLAPAALRPALEPHARAAQRRLAGRDHEGREVAGLEALRHHPQRASAPSDHDELTARPRCRPHTHRHCRFPPMTRPPAISGELAVSKASTGSYVTPSGGTRAESLLGVGAPRPGSRRAPAPRCARSAPSSSAVRGQAARLGRVPRAAVGDGDAARVGRRTVAPLAGLTGSMPGSPGSAVATPGSAARRRSTTASVRKIGRCYRGRFAPVGSGDASGEWQDAGRHARPAGLRSPAVHAAGPAAPCTGDPSRVQRLDLTVRGEADLRHVRAPARAGRAGSWCSATATASTSTRGATTCAGAAARAGSSRWP